MSAAPTFHSAGEASSEGNKWLLPAVLVGVVLFVALMIWLLRSPPELETGYGRRMGNGYRSSVNGTIVFSEMFRYSGRTVTSVDKLSPKLWKYKTIVWFPNDFDVPNKEQREYLERWLSEGYEERTLIYVGRDFDGATAYWSEVLTDAPKDQIDEIKHKRSEAKSKYAEQRARMPKEAYARWFVQREGKARKVTTLGGPWAADIDGSKADISLGSRLAAPTTKDRPKDQTDAVPLYETLLTSEKDALVAKVKLEPYAKHKIIVVTNGSMLLNYPLINHENRKIAGKLIAECAPDGNVAFLESGPGGPSIEKKSAEKKDREWPFPLNAIVFHLVMLSLVFCFARSPIFGRARELLVDSASDFGKHISALGKLMQRTKDQAYAFARLQQYRQHGKRDSGKAHQK